MSITTDIFCWNVRGLNKYNHRSRLRKWFRKNSPFFGGILETHVKHLKMNKFVSELFPGWFSEENYAFSTLGKIWIVWHPSVLVKIISKSLQMITAEVTWPNCSSKFVISVIYASNDVAEREELWSEINNLASAHSLDTKPWLLLGDFNQIRDPLEHSIPLSLNLDKRSWDFNQCLSDAHLEDLNFRGPTFTWWNKQKSSPVAKKLDRGLVNDEWYYLFPSSVALFGSTHFSDHAVLSVSLDPAMIKAKKPFRFYNFHIKNPDFLSMICYNWFSFNVTGSAMYRVSRKLKLLKYIIKDFSRQNYLDIEKKTAEAHEALLSAQSSMLTSPSPNNADRELSATKRWEELSTGEAGFFFQRSRIQWLSFGDGNSRLFQRYAASVQAKNHIHYLISETGQRVESHT